MQHTYQEGSRQFSSVIPSSVGKSPMSMFPRDRDQNEEVLVSYPAGCQLSGKVAATIVEQWLSSLRFRRMSL